MIQGRHHVAYPDYRRSCRRVFGQAVVVIASKTPRRRRPPRALLLRLWPGNASVHASRTGRSDCRKHGDGSGFVDFVNDAHDVVTQHLQQRFVPLSNRSLAANRVAGIVF